MRANKFVFRIYIERAVCAPGPITRTIARIDRRYEYWACKRGDAAATVAALITNVLI
jgi:hypothetical protein